MSTSAVLLIAALIAALGLALVVGRLLHLRTDLARGAAEHEAATAANVEEFNLSTSGPTVVRFTAAWCGPCAAVQKVVDDVCAELAPVGEVAHRAIDMDANPASARRLSVLSLPTTFIFDTDGRECFRASGVPTAADLRSALEPLLA